MIHVECATPVRASRGVAWEILRETAREPQRFLPSISGCEVEERQSDELLRRVTFDDGTAVSERVVLVPQEEVIFQLLDHPKFDGEIRNLLFEEGDRLWLSFLFRGAAKDGVELGPAEFEQVRDGFARAVRAAARRIEEAEAGALERT